MSKFLLAESGHIVNALPPLDIDAAAQTTDYISTALYQHVDFIITLGVTGAASTVTVFESDDAAGSDETAIAFSYYAETTAAGDTLSARTDATASGFATSTNDSVTYVISIDAAQLSDGYPWLAVKFTDPGAATFGSVVAVCSGARYQSEQTATAIV